jgi:single-strand DNA-binding protein
MIVEGFLSGDPEVRESNGKRVANFSIAHQARRKNPQTHEYEDVGETLWVRVPQWEAAADLTEKYLRKGTLVRVEGEPILKAWENNGKSGVSLELKFAKWSIIPRQAREQAPPQQQSAAPAGGDVWNTPTTTTNTFDDQTPF